MTAWWRQPAPGPDRAQAERRLRAALEARAGAVGPMDLRPAAPPSVVAAPGRLPVIRTPVAGTLAALGLAAAVVCVLLVAGVLTRDGAGHREPVGPAHPSQPHRPPHSTPDSPEPTPTRPTPRRPASRTPPATPRGQGPAPSADPGPDPGQVSGSGSGSGSLPPGDPGSTPSVSASTRQGSAPSAGEGPTASPRPGTG